MADSENEPVPAEKKPVPRWIWWVCGILGAAFLVQIAISIYGRPSSPAFLTRSRAEGRSIFPALKMYAADHAGRYPRTLSELVPNYISHRIAYRDPVSRRSYDWMYIQGLNETSPANWIVLASPTDQPDEDPNKLIRIVVRNVGDAEIISTDEFDAQLAEQVKAMAAKAP